MTRGEEKRRRGQRRDNAREGGREEVGAADAACDDGVTISAQTAGPTYVRKMF